MFYTDFLSGFTKDDKHRTITDILAYNKWQLEYRHDYIQLVFPTDEQSMHSLLPPISDDDIICLRENEDALNNIRTMYKHMLLFWKIDDNHLNIWNKNIRRHWNNKNNHNHLRMTRVLKSLKLLQLDEEYDDFCRRINYIILVPECKISTETINIWNNIIKGDNDESWTFDS